MDMGSETTREYLEKLLKQAIKTLGFTPANFNITVPEPDFGDYATNAALILGKNLKKNPAEIAGSIAQAAEALNKEQVFREISAVGGFVNFKLSDGYLAKQALRLAEFISFIPAGKGKKVIFEYSSPNTNKPLHIGHTRNDVYGAACINLLKAIGYNVVTCEIINDRGIHIMKSVLMYMKHGEGKTPSAEKMKPDHFVGKFYQMFAAKASESQESEKQLLEEAQNLLQKWEAGDTGVRKVWRQMNDWFFEGVKQTYEKEGSRFDEVNYESEIYDKGRDLVLQGVSKGIFVKEADGSVSVDFTDHGLDKKTLLRKDGTTLYITQDMYLWDLRNRRHSPDLAIVTTSAEQVYHFKVLKKIFELFKYPWAENFKHLPYEHVFLGKNKMSSREGNAISADELLDSVKKQVREVMRGSERVKAKVDDEKLIEAIAFGAIKYGYLKYEPNTRIYFDLEQTISIEGNTGPYIQYAHARIRSILKNAGSVKSALKLPSYNQAEVDLMRKLLHFSESVQQAANEYKPNLLCNYLYELAQVFSAFYQQVPVLQEKDEAVESFRLNLITATAQVIKNGLSLLGIEAPEEM